MIKTLTGLAAVVRILAGELWPMLIAVLVIVAACGGLVWEADSRPIDSRRYAEIWLWREIMPDLITPVDAAMSDGEITGAEYNDLLRTVRSRPELFEQALKKRRGQAP